MKKTMFLSLAVITVMASSALAADKYEFEEGHSRLFFEVNHLGFTDYNGMFRKFTGTFAFDEKNIEKSTVTVEIDMTSVDGYHEGLNDHLRGKDFFEVEKFPTARFESTHVKKTGDNKAQVKGNLSLHGVTKPVTLDVTINKVGPHPRDPKKSMAGFSARTVIDRGEFGISYGIPAVGKDVTLSIDIESIKSPASH